MIDHKPWGPFRAVLFFLFLVLTSSRAGAVANIATATSNFARPTASDIPNWGTGWPASNVSGWDYVGRIAGASAVYVGNGWVLTAGHVGAGPFTLAGVTYEVVPGSVHSSFTYDTATADITLFQIASPPSLPALTVATSGPEALTSSQDGSVVAIIGYGGSGSQAWGANTVTENNLAVSVLSYTTVDFATATGTITAGSHSATNQYAVEVGDSGGGNFVYDTSTGKWQVAGLNEAIDYDTYTSYFVQLSAYASQINPLISGPSAPGVTATAASSIGQTTATLNGTVNAQGNSTTVSFDYGTTTGYGSSIAGTPTTVTGTDATAVSATLTGLTPGTTYHFRVDGVNSVGTSNGGDVTFTTLPSALQSWRQTYYGTTENAGNAADMADPYGTGVTNLQVFALLGPNQDPATAAISQLPQAQQSGGNLFFSFSPPSGMSGVTYGAEWTTTLKPNDWHAITDTGGTGQHLFSVPVGANSQLFIRLLVSDP